MFLIYIGLYTPSIFETGYAYWLPETIAKPNPINWFYMWISEILNIDISLWIQSYNITCPLLYGSESN